MLWLQKLFHNITLILEFIRGIHLYNQSTKHDKETALKSAAESDIIIMCTGLDSSIEGEEAGGALAGGGGNIGEQGGP